MTRTYLCFASTVLLATTSALADWKAGVAKRVITPEKFMWMSGYSARNKPADGKQHDLWAKALAIKDPKGNTAVLVTLDLIGITRELSDAVCGRLEKDAGVPRAGVMLATSHTHCGPMIERNLTAMVDLADDQRAKVIEYTRALEDHIVAVAKEAIAKLEPAKLEWASGSTDFAVNRRTNKEAEVPDLRTKGLLKGPVDHEVPVLRVSSAGGELRGIVFGYACHNTVLSFYNWCGDYAGFAQIELEKSHPGAVALFHAGCGADQNPLPRRTVELAAGYGKRLADAVDKVLAGKMEPISGALSVRFATVAVPFDQVPTEAELREATMSKNAYEARRAKMLLDRVKASGPLAGSYAYPVQAWKFETGPVWIALGGEVVVDYSLRLKKTLGPGRTWVTGYANDVMAYIPSLRVLNEGGYEGATSMVYYGQPSKWGARIEEIICDKVAELAK